MELKQFFRQQFKKKIHMMARVIVLSSVFFEASGSFINLEGNFLLIAAWWLTSGTLALIVVPLFDVFILRDPLHTETIHPVFYYLRGLVADYQSVQDSLKENIARSEQRLEYEKRLFDSKKLRSKNIDSLESALKEEKGDGSYTPNLRILLVTALAVGLIDYAPWFLLDTGIISNPLFLNQGFQLTLMAFVIFILMPFVDIFIFLNKEAPLNNYAFWQYTYLGRIDQSIKNQVIELSNLNNKCNVFKKASQQLDPICQGEN